MKTRSISAIPFFVFAFAFIFSPSTTQAQTIQCDTPQQITQCKIEYDRTIAEKKQADAATAAAQAKSSSYERDIALLRAKIRAAELDIKAKTILIQTLGNDITKKQVHINQLEARIDKGKETLADLLRRTNELGDHTMAEVLLSQHTVSGFFNDIDTFQSVQDGLADTFNKLEADQASTTAEKSVLTVRQNSEIDARYGIQQQQKKIASDQKDLQSLLNISETNKKAYAALAAQKAAKAAQIYAALFPLAGAKAIPFGDALNYANIASQKTGVRAALILGIIRQESNLGSNVGVCYMTNAVDASGINIKTKNRVMNVMKLSRDVQPFMSLTSALGLDYRTTPVSCPLSYGYGGAMGPAQFIASTWEGIKGRVASAAGITGTANPWNPAQAFMASALLLAEKGAAYGGYTAERNAACGYYGGGNTCKSSNGSSSYGNSVMVYAAQFQQDINQL